MIDSSVGADLGYKRPILTLGQCDAFWRALAAEPNRDAAAALAMLIATGARKDEVRLATWRDVDLERGTLRVQKSRDGRPKYRRLNAFAVEILRQQLGRRENGVAFVFPGGRRAGRPAEGLREVWERSKVRAGLPATVRHKDLAMSAALGSMFLGSSACAIDPKIDGCDNNT